MKYFITDPRHPLLRYLPAALVAIAGGLLCYHAMQQQQAQAQERFQQQLEWRAANEAARFQRTLERSVEIVDGLGGVVSASQHVDRAAFQSFVAVPLQAHPDIQALGWLPKVASDERAAIARALEQFRAERGITQPATSGLAAGTDAPADAFPLLYVEPLADHEALLGFDPSRLPANRRAMTLAADSGELVATSIDPTLTSLAKAPAILLFRPIYRHGVAAHTPEQRRSMLMGFALGVIQPGQILNSALAGTPPTRLDVLLVDSAQDGAGRVLHRHASRSRRAEAPFPSEQAMRSGPHWEARINLPGRQWAMVFAPAPAFHEEFGDTQPWLILVAGLALTTLLTLYLLRQARHREALQVLTRQLSASNDGLAQQARRLSQAQELAHLGSFDRDPIAQRMVWSDQLYQLLELEPRHAPASLESLLERVHPDDAEAAWHFYTQGATGPAPAHLVHRLRMADGRIKHIQARVETDYDHTGAPIRQHGTLQDITERSRVEEQLRLAAKVFDNTQEGIFITDARGNILEVNPAFSGITGYSRDEVLGRNPRLWKSQRHDAGFYRGLWQTLLDSGQWQGEIWNRRKQGEVYPVWQNISMVRDPQGNAVNFVAVFTDISSQKQSQAQLTYLAQHDPLTDLPNRVLLQDRLEHALQRAKRENERLALLFLDLDHFKHINDSLGHPVGDRLLEELARRLRDAVRQEDTVARMGGDEFILLLERIRGPQDAAHLAEKLLLAVARPYAIQGRDLYVTSSIGISLYPRDGDSAETLISNVDAAMYRAKSSGRNAYQFYTQAFTDSALERLQLEMELRRALQEQALRVHYQPQYNLADERLIGAEALLRWTHPTLGPISPDRFIPIAEETGLIIDLGAWVLHQACAQARHWLDAGLTLRSVSVNVAGPQLQRSDFIATVRRTLMETGLAAEHLELEVTEGFIMGQAEASIAMLAELSHMGVQLSIDDFGTGYSSLAYLKRLPIDKLKVDRSFVRDLPWDEEGAAIASAIIVLGRSLGLKIIAEGVETAEQRDFLLKLGCDQAQGWYYGKPVPPEDFPHRTVAQTGKVVNFRRAS